MLNVLHHSLCLYSLHIWTGSTKICIVLVCVCRAVQDCTTAVNEPSFVRKFSFSISLTLMQIWTTNERTKYFSSFTALACTVQWQRIRWQFNVVEHKIYSHVNCVQILHLCKDFVLNRIYKATAYTLSIVCFLCHTKWTAQARGREYVRFSSLFSSHSVFSLQYSFQTFNDSTILLLLLV